MIIQIYKKDLIKNGLDFYNKNIYGNKLKYFQIMIKNYYHIMLKIYFIKIKKILV